VGERGVISKRVKGLAILLAAIVALLAMHHRLPSQCEADPSFFLKGTPADCTITHYDKGWDR
jgi:hypothetical protein